MTELAIIPTAVITALGLAAEHFACRQEIRGRNVSRSAAYAMGTLTIALPLSGLFLFWHYYPPTLPPFFAALVAMWSVGIAGGAVVIYLRHMMQVANLKQKVEINEEILSSLDD